MKRIHILVLTLLVALTGVTFYGSAAQNAAIPDTQTGPERMIHLHVLYPQPNDSATFDAAYQDHAALIKQRTGKPFTVGKLLGNGQGVPGFYQIFTMSFRSMDELEAVLTPEVRQELDADAFRISTGGQPLILVSEFETHN